MFFLFFFCTAGQDHNCKKSLLRINQNWKYNQLAMSGNNTKRSQM